MVFMRLDDIKRCQGQNQGQIKYNLKLKYANMLWKKLTKKESNMFTTTIMTVISGTPTRKTTSNRRGRNRIMCG